MRKVNTTLNGGSWSELQKLAVWKKGQPIFGKSPEVWRNDKCGKTMRYFNHGDRSSAYGWEIDHILPVSKGGTDDPSNLQPLHWENNAAKADQYPWNCR